MILPTFILPEMVGRQFDTTGLDQLDKCLDPQYFKQYPYTVSYQFNSRGYRDCEWPDTVDELKNCIWCIGDSFTVGVGSPRKYTWTYILQQKLQQRIINVSMDGASNQWISRKITELLTEIRPSTVLVHWSYIHRRERQVSGIFSDYQRKQYFIREANDSDDVIDIRRCMQQAQAAADLYAVRICHSFIPAFAPTEHASILEHYCKDSAMQFVPSFDSKDLDRARDGHHYGIVAATALADQFVQRLVQA